MQSNFTRKSLKTKKSGTNKVTHNLMLPANPRTPELLPQQLA
jgi:hypothetical protein